METETDGAAATGPEVREAGRGQVAGAGRPEGTLINWAEEAPSHTVFRVANEAWRRLHLRAPHSSPSLTTPTHSHWGAEVWEPYKMNKS